MKSMTAACLVSLFLLAGCAGDAESVARLEEKVTALEARVATLEQNLQEARLEVASKENDVEKLKEDLRTVATIVDKNSVRLDRVER